MLIASVEELGIVCGGPGQDASAARLPRGGCLSAAAGGLVVIQPARCKGNFLLVAVVRRAVAQPGSRIACHAVVRLRVWPGLLRMDGS